jgi:putative DNA methylase
VILRKKLIEVAVPLEAINIASAREKSIRHGHPSTLHLWWARRPLAAARAVIFAQIVDDPSSHPERFPTEQAQEKERERLFRLIEELVLWANTGNEGVLARAREEIWKSWRGTCLDNIDHPRAKELFDPQRLPPFHDPFAGGGALPLEAQRLGLESYASDLNPVAVLINKAMIEIPPKFEGRPPINPDSRGDKRLIERKWLGAQGLAADVHYYGHWIRKEAEKRIGYLYPKIEITDEMSKTRPDLKSYVGRQLTVIAWLWARTVKSPNPAFAQVDVPLVASFLLGTKPGKEAYVQPIIGDHNYRFNVKLGKPHDDQAKRGTKLSRANFRCVMSGTPIGGDYIKGEGKAGRMGARLMAVVLEGERGRVYLSPTDSMEELARRADPTWVPEGAFVEDARAFTPYIYGLKEWRHLFTPRQLVALTTLSELVQEARERVRGDALALAVQKGSGALNADDADHFSYADAVATYLGLAVGRVADYCSTICTWASNPQMEIVRGTFARQALQMTWDFAEANIFGPSTGSLEILLSWVVKAIERLPSKGLARSLQHDATKTLRDLPTTGFIISADPPYFDNVPYADLSDFFYVWLRRSLKPVFPDLFATLVVPKSEELVAFAYRHKDKESASAFFMDGMTKAMQQLGSNSHPAFPITIYYAFKQAETESENTASTGWETFLEAVIQAGLTVQGTWPIRTERAGRSRDIGSNALASSIVLVCRPRLVSAVTATRRELLTALKAELPIALAHLQRGNIAPVDLAQAAIGPGMAVYTRYAKVLDVEGKPIPVREALALINQSLDEVLAEQEGDFDADSRWALAWFEHSGFEPGEYGVAETLSKAKNTSLPGMAEAHILASKGGKVRLLRPDELPKHWEPTTNSRLTAWEVVHQLIRVLEAGGESAAAEMVVRLGPATETARELAYRLYVLCERKKRAPQALSYNSLVQSWPEITRLAHDLTKKAAEPQQVELYS